MTRSEILAILSRVLPPANQRYDAPLREDWVDLERKFGTTFPPEFVDFVELLPQFEFPGDFYNVRRAPTTNGNDHIVVVFDQERAHSVWPEWLIPFYGIGNGDYFGLDARLGPASLVHYWYHKRGAADVYAKSFGEWVSGLESFLEE